MTGLHVSISAEPIFHLGKFEVTNSMFTGVIVTLILIAFSVKVSKRLKARRAPQGVQNVLEMIFESLLNLMTGIAGEKKASEFFPVIATLFIYILISNWTGLLPGVGTIGIKKQAEATTHIEEKIEAKTAEKIKLEEKSKHTSYTPLVRPPSADLNATLALAIFAVAGSQYVGFKYLKFSYLKKFFNFSNPINFAIGLLELVSELSRILSFAFRLFGNIFAGEVLLSVMLFLLPFLVPLPFIGLEVFIGFIQALVFAVLTLVFWHMATLAHDEQ